MHIFNILNIGLAGGYTDFNEPGDVGGDGKTDIFDLLELLKQIGGSTEKNDLGDVDGDGEVNIFNLLQLLKLIAGK